MNAPLPIQIMAAGAKAVKSRAVREIHQIELSSRCNLRCVYCPSPKLPRAKADMTMETYEKALRVVDHFCARGTQTELSLTGIGEALLHPQFVEMLGMAREVIGPNRPLVVATNGILLTDAMAEKMAPHRPLVFISLHRPERAGLAIEVAKRHRILAGVNASAATSAFNWGGKVNWHVSAPRTRCEYLNSGWGVILQDGQITTCCLDADGAGVVGTVDTPPDELLLRPYSLCDTCHMTVPEVLQ